MSENEAWFLSWSPVLSQGGESTRKLNHRSKSAETGESWPGGNGRPLDRRSSRTPSDNSRNVGIAELIARLNPDPRTKTVSDIYHHPTTDLGLPFYVGPSFRVVSLLNDVEGDFVESMGP